MDPSSAPTSRTQPEQTETSLTKKPRRFAAEPLETTIKSSRKITQQPVDSSIRSPSESQLDHPEHGDTNNDKQESSVTATTRPPRRFAPQPLETSTKHSSSKNQEKTNEIAGPTAETDITSSSIMKRRRFIPEPVETSLKSNRNPQEVAPDKKVLTFEVPHESSFGNKAEESKPARRRFGAQPVESTTTSSKTRRKGVDLAVKTDVITLPADAEGSAITAKPARRKFAPEPVEETSRSSRISPRSKDDDSPVNEREHLRRTTSAESANLSASSSPERRRFAPQLVATASRSTTSSNHRSTASSEFDLASPGIPLLAHEMDIMGSFAPPAAAAPRRKFSPELITTAKRSRKSWHTEPAVRPQDKTNVDPGELNDRRTRADQLRASAADSSSSNESSPTRSLGTRARNGRMKQHSYQIPSLPDIDSSESDEPKSPSLSVSFREDSATSDETYKDGVRGGSSDDQANNYLLDLQAKRNAERQLRDQAAAAFVNSDYHEPVAHYVDNSDSDGELPEQPVLRSGRVMPHDPTRRDSSEEKMALKEMQRHGERLKRLESARNRTGSFRMYGRTSKHDLWSSGSPTETFSTAQPKKMIGGQQRDPDLKQMRKAASPPMLGSEIQFPRCSSPDHARFDVTQGADFLRQQMCYLTEQTTEDTAGLWSHHNTRVTKRPDALKLTGFSNLNMTRTSPRGSRPGSPKDGQTIGGLWGGFCTFQDVRAPPAPSGLLTPQRTPSQTPQIEKEDPFSLMSFGSTKDTSLPLRQRAVANAATSTAVANAGTGVTSPIRSGQRTPRGKNASPPTSMRISGGSSAGQSFMAAVDARFEMEAKVDNEFSDAFVTQVYNYLSLGYPSLARKYDDELSRISRVAVEDLRVDDKLVDIPRGHIGLGDDIDWVGDVAVNGAKGGVGVNPMDCRRWRALRKYVREWGRQMLKKEGGEGGDNIGAGMMDPHRAWGLPARRGSWGI